MRQPRDHRYSVGVAWTGNTGEGTAGYRKFARDHRVVVADKPVIEASADPAFVGDPARWNPEELLVASLAQCHMLTYLAQCSLRRVTVVAYRDAAEGLMRESGGVGEFVEVTLNPVVEVADASMIDVASALHEDAHRDCFIARSVSFPVRHLPTVTVAGS
ncbi:Organic hydroperoxide reductase OsmC/OhrA [Streptomyces zhaozhouensis]|uniref:Organic hydroperoxide reductase OsmC/OhrA n=1 Tax=Streptomyces zhaozhouensis TaxID=1300267 RepID=A0A286E331_9ACTN|nr:OsmC family protein [Streptomyces zhaozhouensis]SOD65306.1 Organic hydroperoxide reductase OsmC/OhrA [Streptomyces zhaozhouensis]